jgi:hypothetical protein
VPRLAGAAYLTPARPSEREARAGEAQKKQRKTLFCLLLSPIPTLSLSNETMEKGENSETDIFKQFVFWRLERVIRGLVSPPSALWSGKYAGTATPKNAPTVRAHMIQFQILHVVSGISRTA